MTSNRCICLGDDCVAAKEAIRRSRRISRTAAPADSWSSGTRAPAPPGDALLDESHFMAALARCARCGQQFLTLFCERVDWADGDDPQAWLAVPVSDDEARQLLAADIAADENVVLGIVAGERRFLYHDMPKGAPHRLAWMSRTLFIPAHD